jgi:hypothetical protein
MPKYLIQASYTAEGLRGLQKDKASGRRQAMSLAIAASGLVRLKTTPLLTVEEADQALAKSISYRAPGK